MTEIIQFKLIDLEAQKPTKTFFSEIQLHQSHIRYRVKFTADEPSADTGIWNKDVGCYHDFKEATALHEKLVKYITE